MPEWDHVTDFLVIGSGGGLVGALRAAALGLDVVVAEKSDMIGGSTGMSGGIIWLPDNPLMKREGVPIRSTTPAPTSTRWWARPTNARRASSQARRETYVTAGNDMFTFLESEGVEFLRCEGYSDYYPAHAGLSADTRGPGRSRPWPSTPGSWGAGHAAAAAGGREPHHVHL